MRDHQASQIMGGDLLEGVILQGQQSLGNISVALGKAMFTLVTILQDLGADVARPELMEKKSLGAGCLFGWQLQGRKAGVNAEEEQAWENGEKGDERGWEPAAAVSIRLGEEKLLGVRVPWARKEGSFQSQRPLDLAASFLHKQQFIKVR